MLFGVSKIGEFVSRHALTLCYATILLPVSVGLVALAMFLIIGLAAGKPMTGLIHDWIKAWTGLWKPIPGLSSRAFVLYTAS